MIPTALSWVYRDIFTIFRVKSILPIKRTEMPKYKAKRSIAPVVLDTGDSHFEKVGCDYGEIGILIRLQSSGLAI
jgi:hypothetical protein